MIGRPRRVDPPACMTVASIYRPVIHACHWPATCRCLSNCEQATAAKTVKTVIHAAQHEVLAVGLAWDNRPLLCSNGRRSRLEPPGGVRTNNPLVSQMTSHCQHPPVLFCCCLVHTQSHPSPLSVLSRIPEVREHALPASPPWH